MKFGSSLPFLRGLLLVALVALSGCGGRVDLLSIIAERDANEVMAELLNKRIAATKVTGKEGNASV